VVKKSVEWWDWVGGNGVLGVEREDDEAGCYGDAMNECCLVINGSKTMTSA
jgi:hypothetical protein